ncbi:hypothetical protein [Halomonas kashgarensis]
MILTHGHFDHVGSVALKDTYLSSATRTAP